MHSKPPSPPRQDKSQFLGHFVAWRGDLKVRLVVLDRVFRAWTEKRKKVVNFFRGKKVHLQTKSWLRLCTLLHIPGYATESQLSLAR